MCRILVWYRLQYSSVSCDFSMFNLSGIN
jgi:hypothetical protein